MTSEEKKTSLNEIKIHKFQTPNHIQTYRLGRHHFDSNKVTYFQFENWSNIFFPRTNPASASNLSKLCLQAWNPSQHIHTDPSPCPTSTSCDVSCTVRAGRLHVRGVGRQEGGGGRYTDPRGRPALAARGCCQACHPPLPTRPIPG